MKLRGYGVLTVLSVSFLSCRSASASMPMRAPAPVLAGDVRAGVALYNQGKYADAVDALKGGDSPEAQAYLAASLVKQKKYGEAEEPAKSAVDAEPANEVGVAALGEALVNLKKYDEAIDRLSASIRADSGLPYAYFWRAQAYQGRKKIDRAVEDFDSFLRLAPNAPEAPAVRQTLAALK
jgi:tetratricopeptide (TPR) repeat protein